MKNKQLLLKSLFSISLTGLFTVGGLSQADLMAAESSSVQINPDGSKLIHDEDGSLIKIESDGTKTIKKTDGTLIQIKSDGSKLIQNVDGSSVYIEPNGTKTIKKP